MSVIGLDSRDRHFDSCPTRFRSDPVHGERPCANMHLPARVDQGQDQAAVAARGLRVDLGQLTLDIGEFRRQEGVSGKGRKVGGKGNGERNRLNDMGGFEIWSLSESSQRC
jgi:hypothetical protein